MGTWSETRHRRNGTTRRRLGLGVSLSAGIHLTAVLSLLLFVTRPGAFIPASGIADSDVVIDLSDFEASGLAQGPPPEPEPGEAERAVTVAPASAAGLVAGSPAPTGEPTGSGGAGRVAAASAPAPSIVRPETRRAASPTGVARRPPRRASRSQPEGTPPAPSTIPAVTAPEKTEAPPPGEASPRVGTPGPSPRTVFLALMKRHLRAAWRAGEVYQRIDPQGRLEGSMFVSGMQVRLRANGTVERAELRDSSGIRDLDLEAQAALARMQPLPPLPAELIDAQGGFDVRCSFHLDVGLFRFANKLHHAIAQHWRPSAAFAATSELERKTIVRITLDQQGALVAASVVASAGIDFLDRNAVSWATPGLKFPTPPPAFAAAAVQGPVPIFVAFLHRAGEPRMLKPREDLEAE